MTNKALIEVGAGSGEGDYEDTFDKIMLMEPVSLFAAALKRKFAADPRFVVVERALVVEPDSETLFKIARPLRWSSLYEHSGLIDQYPGLTVVKEEPVDQITVAELLSLVDGYEITLRLDCCGNELALLDAFFSETVAKHRLRSVTVSISAKTSDFENSVSSRDLCAFFESNLFVLSEDQVWEGRRTLSFSFSRIRELEQKLDNLERYCNEIELSLKNQLEVKEAELVALSDRSEKLRFSLDETKREQQALVKKLRAREEEIEKLGEVFKREQRGLQKENKRLESQLAKRTSEADGLKVQLDQKERDLVELQRQYSQVESQLEETTRDKEGLSRKLDQKEQELEERGQVLDAMNKLEKTLTKRVRQGVESSVKQIEAYMGVRDFFKSGEVGLDFHGWPISSEIGLYLLNLISRKEYDCIVEFGSGTSTLMFAEALLKKSDNDSVEGRELTYDEHGRRVGRGNLPASFAPSEQDVPKRIISFEHHKFYLGKTAELLDSKGVRGIVDLVYAPLVSIDLAGTEYLYYSCESKIESLASAFGNGSAKLLILVDGPPQQTGPQARYPALPIIMNHLSSHEMDILVDDFSRESERTMVDEWKEMLEARSIQYTGEEIEAEKGGYLLRINQ